VPYVIRTDCGGGKRAGVRSIDQPAATIVSTGGLGLVDPKAFVVAAAHGVDDKTGNERRALSPDQPLPAVTGSNDLGTVQPQAFVVPQQTQNPPRSAEDPVPTITTTSRGIGVAQPEAFILPKEGIRGGNLPRSLDNPAQTVVPHHGLGYLVEPTPFMLGQQTPAAPRSVEDPAPTVAGAGAISLNTPIIVQYNGTSDARSVDQPAGTVTGKDRFGLVEPKPFLVANFNERDGQAPRTHSVDDPAPTVTHRGAGDLAVPEFITEYHNDKEGGARVRPTTEPLPTQTTEPRFGLAKPEAFMLSAGGPEVAPRSVEDPAHTV
jgi:hypothetical protein